MPGPKHEWAVHAIGLVAPSTDAGAGFAVVSWAKMEPPEPRAFWGVNPAGSVIAPTIVAAYRATNYQVLGPEPFTLHVGEHSPRLAEAHRARGVASSAYITAHNPRSVRLEAAENARRHDAALSEWAARGFVFLEGLAEDPQGAWPGEPSFLIFGLTIAEAVSWGRRLEQNALLYAAAEAVPQLILLR